MCSAVACVVANGTTFFIVAHYFIGGVSPLMHSCFRSCPLLIQLTTVPYYFLAMRIEVLLVGHGADSAVGGAHERVRKNCNLAWDVQLVRAAIFSKMRFYYTVYYRIGLCWYLGFWPESSVDKSTKQQCLFASAHSDLQRVHIRCSLKALPTTAFAVWATFHFLDISEI